MISTSFIEIDYEALQFNFSFLRKLMGDKTQISAVVKGNAYGHGIETYVPLVEACGIDHFSVFSADEALRVKNVLSPEAHIMIMGHIENEELDWAIRSGIEFFVFEIDRLEHAIKIAQKAKIPAKIHIELETGMNRTGFDKPALEKVVKLIKDHPDELHVQGVCTHFAGAESVANYLRIKNQQEVFRKNSQWLKNQSIVPEQYHAACSAASIVYPKTQMDMVRIGILQYGFWPSREVFIDYLGKKKNGESKEDPLKRVISWKSRVMSTKTVMPGEFVGYGTTFLAQQEMKIATVPVGYSHGYSRMLSNLGRVLINGKRLSVIGIVNMNVMMVDIIEAPETKKGDEVVLIGHQGDLEITVGSFGELSSQLNYELLTRLPHDIPRIVKNKN